MPVCIVICCCSVLFLCLLRRVDCFLPPSHSPSTTSLQAFAVTKWPTIKWPTLTDDQSKTDKKLSSIGERNGIDPKYPWRFEGRFIFRPSLVRTSNDVQPPSANLLSLFGYSLGGSVVLEYDVSPVGPYREYVDMGGVVCLGKVNVGDAENAAKRTLGIGQWGTNLYVSTQIAEDVCQLVWGVPAQVADIEFVESGDALADGPNSESIGNGEREFTLSGWKNARILSCDETAQRNGNVPIYWTPTIKALWAPLLFPGGGGENEQLLPVHKLRLSASALRLKRCKCVSAQEGEIPLGLTLVVDDVLIEIGERITSG